ncbi:MAG: acyltransferase [Verrucomicrobiota bacterium]
MTGILERLYQVYLRRKRPIEYARRIGVKMGKDCKIVAPSGGTFGSEPYLVEFGDHVEISSQVTFVTHDGGAWIFRDEHPDLDVFAPITVGNNVFIGLGSTVLPGTVIGDNCVIGAKSLVRGKLESGGVYAGVPVRFIKPVEDYLEGLLKRDVGTKSFTACEKRKFLEKHFSVSP